MTLSRKVMLIVGLIVLTSCAVSLWIQQAFIMPSFLSLERDTATRNAERALEAIDRELEQLSPSVSDWAYWNDSYRFAQGEDGSFVDDNFPIDGVTMDGMQLNFLAILDTEGRSRYHSAWDLEESTPMALDVLVDGRLPVDHPLLGHLDTPSEVSGLIATAEGPMLAVAKPILDNARQGPPAGTFIMGRLLDEAAIARLAEQTRLTLDVAVPSSTADDRAAAPEAKIARTTTDLTEHADAWRAETVLNDVSGQPILSIAVETERDITARGRDAVRVSLLLLAAMGLATLTLLLFSLRYLLLRPLGRLTAHAARIGERSDTGERLSMKRADEIGLLARTLDGMLDRLAEAQRELVTRSYHSGMSETATGVLHNIGNAITPLNVRLSNLRRDLTAAPTAEVEQAVAELADASTPAERATDLRAFVELAALETATLVRRCEADVDLAAAQIVNVQQILDDQQRFAHSARVLEPVDVGALLADAAAGLDPSFQSNMRVEIEPSVAEVGPVHAARAALLQVVTNLLVNAAEAIADRNGGGTGSGLLRVEATTEEHEGVRVAHFCFTDDGGGVREEDLPHVFELGFSTRRRDGSGQGLHWSANTVRDLGGSLHLENDATGTGCRVHLTMPLEPSVAVPATGTGG